MTSNYFQPTITIDASNINDNSQMVGVVPTLLLPANADRIGFMLQSHSETNDFWWGYDSSVSVGGAGYYCLVAADRKPFNAPPNGVFRGAIYGLSDGGGKVTIKEWNAT